MDTISDNYSSACGSSADASLASGNYLDALPQALATLSAAVVQIQRSTEKLVERVSTLESSAAQSAPTTPVQSTPLPKVQAQSASSASFCDEDMDQDEDEEEGDQKQSFKVSSSTTEFVNSSFVSGASNQLRRQWRAKFGVPNLDVTRTPKLDNLVKSRLPAATKSRDKELAKQQSLLLDATAPLIHVMEEHELGTLTAESAINAVQYALRFIGNASLHLSRERRKNAISSMNRSLVDMADDDDSFREAAPALFGDGFSKRAKERSEELRCLSQVSSETKDKQQFFQKSRSSTKPSHTSSRGGFSNRGKSYRPYPKFNPFKGSKKDQNNSSRAQ